MISVGVLIDKVLIKSHYPEESWQNPASCPIG